MATKQQQQLLPHPPHQFCFLKSADSNNYVHQYAAYRQSLSKISEIENSLSGGNPSESNAVAHLAKLREGVASTNWGKGFMHPPELMIADHSPFYSPDCGRILVARRIAEKSLRFMLYRDRNSVTSHLLENVVMSDPKARNVPYSPLCMYPFTEERKDIPCGVFIDTEEDFIEPKEAYDVPTDDELVKPSDWELDYNDPAYRGMSSQELAVFAHEKRVLVTANARKAFEARWKKREADFALRCRWVLILIRQSIAAVTGLDLTEAGVWWYSACSRKKNSFRIYIPDWIFANVDELQKVMGNALAILNLLPEDHPCKVALRRAPDTVRTGNNPYIIDWGVYHGHQQMRAPFQRKHPTVDNAFVPYDIVALDRIPINTLAAVRQWFEPSLCMALHGQYQTLSCFHKRLPFLIMDDSSIKLRDATLTAMNRLLGHYAGQKCDAHISPILSAAAALFKTLKYRCQAEIDRLARLRSFATKNNNWILDRGIPRGFVARHSRYANLLLAAFILQFSAQALRFVLSARSEHADSFVAPREREKLEKDAGITPGLLACISRAEAYHTCFARIALGRDANMRLPADLVPPAEKTRKSGTAIDVSDQHTRNLLWMLMMPPGQSVNGPRTSERAYGSLIPFEPGNLSEADLLIIWDPTPAEKRANRPNLEEDDVQQRHHSPKSRQQQQKRIPSALELLGIVSDDEEEPSAKAEGTIPDPIRDQKPAKKLKSNTTNREVPRKNISIGVISLESRVSKKSSRRPLYSFTIKDAQNGTPVTPSTSGDGQGQK